MQIANCLAIDSDRLNASRSLVLCIIAVLSLPLCPLACRGRISFWTMSAENVTAWTTEAHSVYEELTSALPDSIRQDLERNNERKIASRDGEDAELVSPDTSVLPLTLLYNGGFSA